MKHLHEEADVGAFTKAMKGGVSDLSCCCCVAFNYIRFSHKSSFVNSITVCLVYGGACRREGGQRTGQIPEGHGASEHPVKDSFAGTRDQGWYEEVRAAYCLPLLPPLFPAREVLAKDKKEFEKKGALPAGIDLKFWRENLGLLSNFKKNGAVYHHNWLHRIF